MKGKNQNSNYRMTSQANIKFIPVFIDLLHLLSIDKKDAINKAIAAGVYHYSLTMKQPAHEIIWKNVLYQWLQRRDVPNYARQVFEKYGIEREDCFKPGLDFFLPTVLLIAIVEGKIQNDAEVFAFGQFLSALDFVGVKAKNPFTFFEFGQRIYKSLQSPIFGMVSKEVLFRYRDEPKTEQDLAELCCFVAIKSVLGRNKIVKTNLKHIIARAFPDPPESPENALKVKYQTRRRWDKIKQGLELNWNVKFYWNHFRGFYVSTDPATTWEQIAAKAEAKKIKNRVAELKRIKAAARDTAIQKSTMNV